MAKSIGSLGHVKLPHQRLIQTNVKVAVDLRLNEGQYLNRLQGFSLRLFAPKDSESAQPEIGMNLSVDQFFDLMEAMKGLVDVANAYRSEVESEIPA